MVPKPSAVAILMASLRAMIKLELAVNLGSISESVASLGSEFWPHTALLKPHTRYAKFLVVLKLGAEEQLRS